MNLCKFFSQGRHAIHQHHLWTVCTPLTTTLFALPQIAVTTTAGTGRQPKVVLEKAFNLF